MMSRGVEHDSYPLLAFAPCVDWPTAEWVRQRWQRFETFFLRAAGMVDVVSLTQLTNTLRKCRARAAWCCSRHPRGSLGTGLNKSL